MDTQDRITAPVGEFCKLSGIGRSLVYEMIGDGRLESITIGKRRLIVIDSYRRLVERLRAAPAPGLRPGRSLHPPSRSRVTSVRGIGRLGAPP